MGRSADSLKKEKTDVQVYTNDDSLFRTPAILKNIELIVNKSYLQNIEKSEIVENKETDFDIAESACFFPIHRIVLDKHENSLQKLTSVYASAGSMGANLAMIIRGYESGETELYLGVCCENSRINGAYPKAKGLFDSFIGNFPGCRDNETALLNRQDIRILQNKCFDLEYTAVSSVSCIASARDNNGKQNSGFYQGLEKVIETMSGKKYTIIILARPVQPEEIDSVRTELEMLYTNLSVYSKIQVSSNWSAAQSISKSYTETITDNINKTKSASLNVGRSNSYNQGVSNWSSSSLGVNAYGLSIGNSDGVSYNQGQSESMSFGKAVSDAISRSAGKSAGKTDGDTKTNTIGETIQLTVENKSVSDLLKRIDEKLKRISHGKGLGMFSAAAYILTPTLSDARIAASSFKAIVYGTETELENSAVNIWYGAEYKKIVSYLRCYQHPVFLIREQDGTYITATPAVMNTSEELSIFMGLPRNNINGISVRESVGFECNIIRTGKYTPKDSFNLGKIYHLGCEEKTDVTLNLDSLTMHTFVTGTTGSGKSNTIYSLLNNALIARPGLHFMVIEPAKGEYKTVFGHRDDVEVYGTNKEISKLLRINPFRFRRGVHVLEHIDYLISVFNVCWPMEAAMPSVLKQAVERAYEISGWNLRESNNKISQDIFPTFQDVFKCINQIMDESDYSAEIKGNYKGALATRLRELTTGTNSTLFCSNDLSDEDLFDNNVIIDLSRLGSSETKALIMGLLVIRLKEYRQCTTKTISSGLRHITVLEEAHNILKRISTEQSIGTANITGKSVEMLSNSLAEMRSTGEGFIIVDQAPGLLDLSVIRNTNTKIVLRLPESSDRELIGHSIGLNAEQIDELAKLPTGIAAVYQNDWFGASLVKIPYWQVDEEIYECPEDSIDDSLVDISLGNAIAHRRLDQWLSKYFPDNTEAFFKLPISGEIKKLLTEYSSKNMKDRQSVYPRIVCAYFDLRSTFEKAINAASPARIRGIVERALPDTIDSMSNRELDYFIFILVNEYYLQDERFEKIAVAFQKYMQSTY